MKYLFVGLMVAMSMSVFLWVLLLSQNQDLRLLNQKLQEKFQGLSMRYVNLDFELKQLRSQLGRLQYQHSLLNGQLLKNPVERSEYLTQLQLKNQDLMKEIEQLRSLPQPQFESLAPYWSPQLESTQEQVQCRCNNQATDQQGCC